MSEISLRDYLVRLDQLAQAGSADEVLWHARHILQYYPKNVDAYRFVGRALVSLGRWDQANATLRRVLSVLPNDRASHLLLSTAYERQHRMDEAIWHLERAFEQDPNDTYLIDELKRLYHEHRHIANPRIQFTTAAVARQNIRSRDFDRAIEALRASLKRTPQRADLRLLLAEALWQRGNSLDAAETAMDVLETYPNCLEANKMLATLWLSEQRPSDARRHLNKVEAVDPYLAIELVQGLPADDNSFMLPELDYQRRIQAELVSEHPDWLQNIDLPVGDADESTSLPSTSGLIERGFADYGGELPESMAGDPSTPVEQDWLSHLDSIEMSYQLNTSALQSTTSPLADDDAVAEDQLPDLGVPTDDADQEFAFEWANDEDMGSPEEFEPSIETDNVLPENAVHEGEFELETEYHIEEDPFEWMNAETPSANPEESMARPEAAEAKTEDPLAWLRSSGIEVVDNPSTTASMLQELEEIVYEDPEIASEADPLNWLNDYSTDKLAGGQEDEGLTPARDHGQDDSTRKTDEVSGAALEPLEDEFPMPDLDMIVDDWTQQPATPNNPFVARAAQTMPLNLGAEQRNLGEDNDDLTNSLDEWEINERLLNEARGLEPLTTAAQSSAIQDDTTIADEFSAILDAVPNSPPTSPLPPMSDEEWDALDKAMTSEPSSSEGKLMSDSQKPDLEWDDETPKENEEESTGATGMLDWLDKNKNAEQTSSLDQSGAPVSEESTGTTGILSWLAQGDNPSYDVTSEQISTSEEPTGSTGILNWLSQNRPMPPTVPLGQEDAEQEFSTADLNVPETPAWLEDLDAEKRLESALQDETGATDILDWLGDNQVVPTTEPLDAQPATGDILPPDTSWLNELYEDSQPAEAQLPSTSEILWDEEQDAQALVADGGPIGEWLAAETLDELLPDLPLTEPFGSEADLEANVGTAELVGTANTAILSSDDSFAALADWLQTSDLDDASDGSDTGVLPLVEETNEEAFALDMSDQPAMGAAEAVASDWALSEPNVSDWTDEETPLGFELLMDEHHPEEPAFEEPTIAEIEHDVPIDTQSEHDLLAAEPPFAGAALSDDLQPAAESSAEEFVNSLLDTGETQSVPDWMTDVTGSATPAEAFDAEPLVAEVPETDAELDAAVWLDETPDESASPEEAPSSTPDWLLDAAAPVAAAAVVAATLSPSDDEQPAQASEEFWDLEVPESNMPDDVFEPVAVIEPEQADWQTAADDAATDNKYYSAFEDLAASEPDTAFEAATTGSNAPDWLNAMVPGLDIDTAAGAGDLEDVIEEDISEETANAANTAPMPDDYEWLNEIVDEETKSDIAVPAVAVQAPRFVFSRPPRWLRRLIEGRGAASEVTDDSDLPAWLR